MKCGICRTVLRWNGHIGMGERARTSNIQDPRSREAPSSKFPSAAFAFAEWSDSTAHRAYHRIKSARKDRRTPKAGAPFGRSYPPMQLMERDGATKSDSPM